MYSIEGKNESYVASGDLSTMLNRVVDIIGDFTIGAALAGGGYGVLQNAPKDKEHAAVATDGVVMVRVGAAVTAGQDVTSAASGWAVVVTSGAGLRVLGRIEVGAASGMLAPLKLKQFYRPNSVGN